MIKDTPKGLPDSALDFEREPTEAQKEMVDRQDVVKYMERTYPEMTGEFLKRFQKVTCQSLLSCTYTGAADVALLVGWFSKTV